MPARNGLACAFVLVAVAAGAAGCFGGGHKAAAPKLEGATVLPGSPAANFTLHDSFGRTVSLSGQRGRVVLLTFLYTRCRDVCPLVAAKLNSVLQSLGPERSQVSVLAVSVDPVGDTAKAVRAYVRQHRLLPQFHFLIGTKQQLQPVWQDYNVLAIQRNAEVVDHSATTLAIGRKGQPRVFYAPSFKTDVVLHDVRVLLAGTA